MKLRRKMRKSSQGVSFIGGADGPTSIFIAKKKCGFWEQIRRNRYKRNRAKIHASISAKPHTLDEVIAYMKKVYQAQEVSEESIGYQEQYKHMRESLILRHKPELLGELQEIGKPEYSNEKAMERFWKKVEARAKKASEIPNDIFPMDFHIYKICIPELGEIDFEIEKKWNVLLGSYSGNEKGMKKMSQISKDIYLYHGVSEADIRNHSERLDTLVTVLTS